MRPSNLPLYSLVLILSALGCKHEQELVKKKVAETVKSTGTSTGTDLTALSEKAQKLFADSDISVDELQKLARWEYKIIELTEKTGNSELESTLNKFGFERWECFQIEPQVGSDGSKSLRLFLRRRPDTLLRFVPQSIIGR